METHSTSVAALVLAGDGLNCERETGKAFETAGAQVTVANYFSLSPMALQEFDILAIPGGFSFGDEISSGRVLAIKLQKHFGQSLREFCQSGKPVIGICNGFQVLVELDLLDLPSSMDLRSNRDGNFHNQWMALQLPAHFSTFWTKGIDRIWLPVRNGEGRLCALGSDTDFALSALAERGQITFVYDSDWNGSLGQIAGLTNRLGNVLGLMPHPESALDWRLNPTRCGEFEAKKNADSARVIFKNAIVEAQRKRGFQ